MSYEKIMYEKIISHFNCDNISIAKYGDGENVAIECNKCNEVIIDIDKESEYLHDGGWEDEAEEFDAARSMVDITPRAVVDTSK